MRVRFCLARPTGDAFESVCKIEGDVQGLDKSLRPAMYRVEVPRSIGVQVGWRYLGITKTLTVSDVADAQDPLKVVLTCSLLES